MVRLLILAVILISVMGCSKVGVKSSHEMGQGGSLARFTIVGNYLYIADHSEITSYNITNPADPQFTGSEYIGFGVETIFPYGDKLFIGSQEGMYIFGLDEPSKPHRLGQALHLRSCDPVVTDGSYAYVTLRSGTNCGTATAGLYIYDVSNDLQNPPQLSLLPIDEPWGLAIKENVAFVCTQNGLTLVNVESRSEPKIMYTRNDEVFRDVIVDDNFLICYVASGLSVYDISDVTDIRRTTSYKY